MPRIPGYFLPPAIAALFACLALAACAPMPAVAVAPQDAFFASLRSLCGQAFAGVVETDVPAALLYLCDDQRGRARRQARYRLS